MGNRSGKRTGGPRAQRPRPLAAGRATLAALAAGAALLVAAPAYAAPAGEVPTSHGAGLAITPVRLIVPAGQVVKVQQLVIENRGSMPLLLHAEVSAFTQAPNGSAIPEADAPYSAARWITVTPDELRLMPGTRRLVRVRIRVPPRAEPGDHYLEIIFLAPPVAGKGNIHIAAGIGVPVLITVPGPVIDDVRITGLTGPGFSSGGAIPVTVTVRQNGDVHHSFRGAGQQLTADADGTRVWFPAFTVLRESTVTMTARWANPPAICVCHITVTVITGGHRSLATMTVVIFPVAQALAGTALLIVLVLAFPLARRRTRRRLKDAHEAGRTQVTVTSDEAARSLLNQAGSGQVASIHAPSRRVSPRPSRLRRFSAAVRRLSQAWFAGSPR